MTDDDPFDELFDRMRLADPAANLPSADPDRVARLLEDVVRQDQTHDTTTETRETGTHHRSPLTWLVAAAAVVLIATAGVFTFGGDEPTTPTAGVEPTEAAGESTVTELTLPEATAGRCMVPNAQALSGAAYAVDAEVSAVSDGVVTLEATTWYAGEPTDQVEVAQSDADLQALIGATEFEEGQRYLVAGTDDGRVMVCGFSGPYSADLAELYSQAFGS